MTALDEKFQSYYKSSEMSEPNLTAKLVKTWGGGQPRGATTENVRIIKVVMIHPLSTMDNFMAVRPEAVEIFQSEVAAWVTVMEKALTSFTWRSISPLEKWRLHSIGLSMQQKDTNIFLERVLKTFWPWNKKCSDRLLVYNLSTLPS